MKTTDRVEIRNAELAFRAATPEDMPRIQAIRRAAFAPVFASFRSMLGEALYEIAQRRDDEGQESLLASLLAESPGWTLYAAIAAREVVGFVAVHSNGDTGVGEVGLNAVDPAVAGCGIGTAMYRFAVDRLRDAGMKVAVVSTGGDPSHAAARSAYRKAGFTVEVPSVWMCRRLDRADS